MPGISARSLGGRGEKGCSGELLLELLSTPTSSHTHTHTHMDTHARERVKPLLWTVLRRRRRRMLWQELDQVFPDVWKFVRERERGSAPPARTAGPIRSQLRVERRNP